MARRQKSCCKDSYGRIIFIICIFGVSSLISYLAVSWKLSNQWTPDIINRPKTISTSSSSYMIQPDHASNMDISIKSHSIIMQEHNQLKSSPKESIATVQNSESSNHQSTQNHETNSINNNPSYHSKWGTLSDPHLEIGEAVYEETDFSLWWTDGDGSPLFINASKYDKGHQSGYESFVFCPIPKVGCSAWKQVMRRIKGIDAYLADDYWSLHHYIENGLEMDRIYRSNASNVDVNAANKILKYIDPNTNKSIYHAAFVRDSLERALSAFLDKCVHSEWHTRYWCIPQSNKLIGMYSNFDVFVEAIISKAQKPKSAFLQIHSFWGLDYHWLPQNWICDLYKFIHRYHIYDADNIMDRKNFFLNIGGQKAWNAIGATGWFHHENHRRLRSMNLFKIPHYEKNEYVDTVNNVRREHPPRYRGYKSGDVLNISGSLLSENAAHAQNTRQKVFSYFRSDLVGKLIVFYSADYVLFERKLPEWICPFVNIEPLQERMDSVIEIYKEMADEPSKNSVLKKEWEILFGIDDGNGKELDVLKQIDVDNLLTFGKTSIFNEDTLDLHKENVTQRNEALIYDNFRNKTKFACFYDLLLYVDDDFDSIFAVLRGLSFLLDVLSSVNVDILPNKSELSDGKCIITKDEIRKKKNILMDVMNAYFNEYIPRRLKFFQHENEGKEFEKAWIAVMKCLDLRLTEEDRMDYMKLYDEWREENQRVIAQIKSNYLYTRDVPRKGKLLDGRSLQDHRAKIMKRYEQKKKRPQKKSR